MDQSTALSLFDKVKAAMPSSGLTNFPTRYWILLTNIETAGSVILQVPKAGTLWLFYEYGSAEAEVIEVIHQGGTTTSIALGENNIPVQKDDLIYYQLTDPATDSIKLGYHIIS